MDDRYARSVFAAVERRIELETPEAWDGAGPDEEQLELIDIERLRKELMEQQGG